MSAMDVVKAGLTVIEASDFNKLDSMIVDDFIFAGRSRNRLASVSL